MGGWRAQGEGQLHPCGDSVSQAVAEGATETVLAPPFTVEQIGGTTASDAPFPITFALLCGGTATMAVVSVGLLVHRGLCWTPSHGGDVPFAEAACDIASDARPERRPFLVNTKTTQRNLLQSEKVLIKEKIAIESLRYLCAGLRKEDFLVTTSAAKFRSVWKDVVQHLGLQDFNYLPYSIRRGAATAAYNEGATFDELLERGRWRHIATARLYLDQALQEYACINLPVQKLPLIRAAQRRFVAAELGKRGKEG